MQIWVLETICLRQNIQEKSIIIIVLSFCHVKHSLFIEVVVKHKISETLQF